MAKILLTGGAGFIGSHTYVALIEAGHEVIIFDNYENAKLSVIDRLRDITQRNVLSEKGDVLNMNDLHSLFETYPFDGVIHFAAKKAVGESSEIPLDYISTNVSGTLNILEMMRKFNVRNFVFSSTATVYGEPEIIPITESTERGFTNPYSFTKFTIEHTLEAMARSKEDWCFGILRYFNPAGAHESGLIGEDPSDIPNNLMPYIAKVALGELNELSVFGNDYNTHDGTGVRDYIHISDLAKAHVLSIEALLRGTSHTVNIGTGQGYSVLDMVESYQNASAQNIPYKIAPRRAGDVDTLVAAVEKAEKIIGFKAEKNLDDMCRDSWKWIKTQKDF